MQRHLQDKQIPRAVAERLEQELALLERVGAHLDNECAARCVQSGDDSTSGLNRWIAYGSNNGFEN